MWIRSSVFIGAGDKRVHTEEGGHQIFTAATASEIQNSCLTQLVRSRENDRIRTIMLAGISSSVTVLRLQRNTRVQMVMAS